MKISHFFQPSRKKVIILIVLATIAFFAFNSFFKPKPQTLQFTQVKKQDIKATVSSSGTLTGKTVANLKFKSAGKLGYINVKIGDKVYVGQVIAGLDTQALAIALQQAQNTLRDKQAIAQKVEDDSKNHDTDESFALKATRTTAQAARDSAYDSVKEAQRAFQDAVITTPISGIVVTQAIQVAGQTVSGSDLITQVVDTSSIYFDTDVDEADISKVSVGQTSEITLDAYGEKIFKGVVDQIIPQTKTTSSGTTVVTIRIKIDDPKLTFINDLTGQASIVLSEAKNVLTIPQEALREDNTVFIQADKGVRTKKVTPGIKSDTEVEIKQGLEEDEKVLLNPPSSGNGNRNQKPLGGIFRLFGGGRGR